MAAPYATVADMVTRYGQTYLEKFVSTITGGTTNALLTEILTEVSDEIESYCRAGSAGFVTPLSSTPGVIKTATIQMAHYYCWDRAEGRTPPENITKQYERWIQWLRDLVAGKVKLDVSTDPTADSAEQPKAQVYLDYEDVSMTTGKGDSDYNSLGGLALDDTETSD